MRGIHRLLWPALGILLLPVVAAAEQPLRWQPTLENARRLAAQTNRLVLIYFSADSCAVCHRMDREVLSQPGVAAAVEDSYVPVKINADHFPTTCRQYGVTRLPTYVVITPQGQRVDQFVGILTAPEYTAWLNRAAAAGSRSAPDQVAQAPRVQIPATAGVVYPPQAAAENRVPYVQQPPVQQPPAQQPPAQQPPVQQPLAEQLPVRQPRVQQPVQQQPNPRYAQYPSQQARPAVSPSDGAGHGLPPLNVQVGQPPQPPATVAASPARPQPPVAVPSPQPAAAAPPPAGREIPGNPPLGLDGYCPVQLIRDMDANPPKWTLGDRRWGAIHRGRTYLFAGPEQQRQFLADPDRYAPVLSGNDAVIALEQGQAVSGHRAHGVFFAGQIYLFASEASLTRFSTNPQHYATQVLQAMRAEDNRRLQLR